MIYLFACYERSKTSFHNWLPLHRIIPKCSKYNWPVSVSIYLTVSCSGWSSCSVVSCSTGQWPPQHTTLLLSSSSTVVTHHQHQFYHGTTFNCVVVNTKCDNLWKYFILCQKWKGNQHVWIKSRKKIKVNSFLDGNEIIFFQF